MGEITHVNYSMDPDWCGGQHNSKSQVGHKAWMDGWVDVWMDVWMDGKKTTLI